MKIEVTKIEKTMIVAALMAFEAQVLAARIAAQDSADDGPEVAILSVEP